MRKPPLQEALERGTVMGRSGTVHPLRDGIDPEESRFLGELIAADLDIRRTLEVGCAFGVSSLVICAALEGRPGANHTIIDPHQNTQWDGAGVLALERAGFDFFRLLESPSEFALPRLAESMEGQFDLVFVDGWHTFDHTLVDCFYATRLLREGGYLVIDDVSFRSVHRVVAFLLTYPCFTLHGSVGRSNPVLRAVLSVLAGRLARPEPGARARASLPGRSAVRMVALRKIGADRRNWDWDPG